MAIHLIYYDPPDEPPMSLSYEEFKKTRKHPFPGSLGLQSPEDRARCSAVLDHIIENFRFHLTTPAAVGSNKAEWENRLAAYQDIRALLLGERLPEEA